MNTFDLVGAIELTVSAAILIGSLAGGLGHTARTRIGAVAAWAAWFGLIVLLAAAGTFDAEHGIGIGGVGAALALPVVILTVAGNRLARFRSAIAELPLGLLVSINAVRVLGIAFVLLHLAGRLPAPFAPVAGWGDVFIGLLALPVAWAVARRSSHSRAIVLLWNVLGLLDLVAAVGLGVTSAPDSPIRIFFEEPGNRIMGDLPWILIPGFIVPNLMLTHLAIFWKLRSPSDEVAIRRFAQN
jgi:hypothetical protein